MTAATTTIRSACQRQRHLHREAASESAEANRTDAFAVRHERPGELLRRCDEELQFAVLRGGDR